jgi:hypothetical protein
MASHEEDSMPDETQGYKMSQPKQSLATYQQMGKLIPKRLGTPLSEASNSYSATELRHAKPSPTMAQTLQQIQAS